ncbi:MAG TPA: chromosome segregation protein SMC [Candidatus Acidoferrum sp.]|nr:chromosome segregation protein SMC [Candidatus Acidoferrum sp.]
MLKLRKVEITGFKSFCERTVVTFAGIGTTCIVGPNGCGKSNVVDAISWVLGEQSHKSLRAERMADCIFNGTVKRPPMGLAEVTITLEDPELAEAAKFVLDGPADGANGLAASAEAGGGVNLLEDGTAGSEIGTPAGDILAGYADAGHADEHGAGLEGVSAEGAEIVPVEVLPADSAEPEFLKGKRKKKMADKHALTTKPGEVVVSRRLYRSGQSEYLINGRVGRLRDIQEMFMGVGLGPDSYAIIEQGRIGQILSTKPLERRAIIEEAAGVTKFKTKKRLAEAKLESSKLNLSRVNDIVVEVEKQLGSLKRQAAKARRYAEIRDEMRGIVRQMLAGKARELDAEAERVGKRLEELMASESKHANEIQTQEAEQDRLQQRVYELDTTIKQNQNVLNMTGLEVVRNENKISYNEQRAQELAGRGGQIATEITAAAAQIAEWEARNSAQLESVSSLRTESATLTGNVNGLTVRAQTRASQIHESEVRIDALRQCASEAGESLLRLHGEQKQAEEALVHQAAAMQKLETTEGALLEMSLQVRDSADAAAVEWETANAQLTALRGQVAALQTRIAGLREERDATAKQAEALRDSLSGARAKHATLTQVLNDRSYTADAVQKLFAANERGGGTDFHAVGVLADYAEVEQQHETAIEQYLRDELEYVVVQTYDHARAGVSMLRDEVGGRATFFVDSLRSLNLRLDEYEPIVNFRAEDGVVSRLDKLVEFRDPLGPAAKQFLPRLKAAYLTDSVAAAEKLARDNPQYAFVTPDGTCYQGRMVTGGRADEAGPLVMKRELRALDADIAQLEFETERIKAMQDALASDLKEAEQTLEEISTQQHAAERDVLSAKHRHEQTQAELARLGLELTSCQSELGRIRQNVDGARSRAEQAKTQLAVANTTRAEAEAESTRLAEELVQLRASIQTEQDELAVARAELAALNERLSASEALASRLQQEREGIDRRTMSLQQQQTSISEEAAGLVTQNEQLTVQLEALRAEKTRLEESQVALEAEWDAGRKRLASMEDTLRFGRQSLQETREQRGHAEVERARNDSDRQHLRETCISEVNMQPEDLIATETAFISGEELAIAETNYREMKSRIESMGAVNMMALEEFNETEQRFSFMTRERDDLIQSIADTQQAIVELDQVTREKFEQAFHAINTNFSTAFHTIFGGGHAEMRLTEVDSSGDAGIDVIASPPGKRMQNILLLSGGEKAMTALALLIAIFKYQPSPFCILDEVDAPLDEANVGRFTKLVGEMSSQTQFIIVTHNRKTMETGSVLYGVTMQEPGVSKLVSVRWEGDEMPKKTMAAAASAA